TVQSIEGNNNTYTNHNLLSFIHIAGDKQTPIKDRQHGIDLWKSHQNEIRHSSMKDVQDGIYAEKKHILYLHVLTYQCFLQCLHLLFHTYALSSMNFLA